MACLAFLTIIITLTYLDYRKSETEAAEDERYD